MPKAAFIMAILLILTAASLFCEETNPLDDMLSGSNQTTLQDSLTNDIIRVNYAQKNARLAMLYSALLPGAGQFYADKASISKFIYPVIELAVIGGMIYYNGKGNDKADAYKDYVNETISYEYQGHTYTGTRYNRDFQTVVESSLQNIHSADIYDGEYFNLDLSNTQHFYEDIGKYDKYIFGWVDWYAKYADPTMTPVDDWPAGYAGFNPVFAFSITDTTNQYYNSYENTWEGNYPYGDNLLIDKPNSAMRAKYVRMRSDAEDQYRTARYISFGLALNHIVSAIDAARLANKVNKFYLSDSGFKFNYYASLKDGFLTPMLGVQYRF